MPESYLTPDNLVEVFHQSTVDATTATNSTTAAIATKRPAEDLSVTEFASKRSKTDDPSDISAVGQKTLEDVKSKANAILYSKNKKIANLQSQIEDYQRETERLESERDDWRLQAVQASAKEEIEKRNREASDRALLKASFGQLKSEAKEDYAVRLREKTTSVEEKFKARLEQKDQKLSDSAEALRNVKACHTEEVRDLKKAHKDEVRDLKDELREVNKLGGGKARKILKNKEAELVEMERECKRLTDARGALNVEVQTLKGRLSTLELSRSQCNQDFLSISALQRRTGAELSKAKSERDQFAEEKAALALEVQTVAQVLKAASAFRDVTDTMPLKHMGNYGLTLEELRAALMQYEQQKQVNEGRASVTAKPACVIAGQPSLEVD